MLELKTLKFERHGDHVVEVVLNRPAKGNAMSPQLFRDLAEAFEAIEADESARAVVLRAEGRNFTYGLDLVESMAELGPHFQGGLAGKRKALRAVVKRLQHQTGGPSWCSKPVVAAVQGWCIGGGLDLISACDIRLCTADARFSLREARIGIVADLGSLQRLPTIIGDAATRELALTAKDIDAQRAVRMGLVSDILEDHEALVARARQEAQTIAELSPLVVQGVKHILNAQQDQAIERGLDYVATWNSAFLASEDLGEAMAAFFEKRTPEYKGR